MIDLRTTYPRYKIVEDEDYSLQDSPEDQLYHLSIVCRFGTISLYDSKTFYVNASANKKIVNKLDEIAGTYVMSLGDEEAVMTIPITEARKVFRVLKPKLNDEEAKKIRERFNK